MKKRRSQSRLQNSILLWMDQQAVDSIARLARELGAHRSSVSRAMHALSAAGFVSKKEGYWDVTLQGKKEAQYVRIRLPEREIDAAQKLGNLIEQSSLSALSPAKFANDMARNYQSALDAATKTARLTSVFITARNYQSALDIARSTQFYAASNALDILPTQPTISEIAAFNLRSTQRYENEAVIATLNSRLAQEALERVSQCQRLSSASIEQVSALGSMAFDTIKELGRANLELSHTISSLAKISTHTSAAKAATESVTAMMPNVAEITRTYKDYLAYSISDVEETIGTIRHNIRIDIPTRTTSAYVFSVNAVIPEEEMVDEDIYSPREHYPPWEDRLEQLDEALRTFGTNYSDLWQGSWAVLNSESPDRVRQAAHSGRELLMQILAVLAPDSTFSAKERKEYGKDGKVTRRMRVKKILVGNSNSAVNWADAVARALEETYDRLTAVSHSRSALPKAGEKQVAGLLLTLGGLLLFIDGSRR